LKLEFQEEHSFNFKGFTADGKYFYGHKKYPEEFYAIFPVDDLKKSSGFDWKYEFDSDKWWTETNSGTGQVLLSKDRKKFTSLDMNKRTAKEFKLKTKNKSFENNYGQFHYIPGTSIINYNYFSTWHNRSDYAINIQPDKEEFEETQPISYQYIIEHPENGKHILLDNKLMQIYDFSTKEVTKEYQFDSTCHEYDLLDATKDAKKLLFFNEKTNTLVIYEPEKGAITQWLVDDEIPRFEIKFEKDEYCWARINNEWQEAKIKSLKLNEAETIWGYEVSYNYDKYFVESYRIRKHDKPPYGVEVEEPEINTEVPGKYKYITSEGGISFYGHLVNHDYMKNETYIYLAVKNNNNEAVKVSFKTTFEYLLGRLTDSDYEYKTVFLKPNEAAVGWKDITFRLKCKKEDIVKITVSNIYSIDTMK
jgi:hypothetical protein